MIDVVHTKQGKSFRGLVSYLLEGSKGQENPDRVAWTETRNLVTDKPLAAARVMAATALEQPDIMREAGGRPRSNASKRHVLHYTLSWAEGAEPSREEMMRAVNGSLAVLGETKGKKGGRKRKDGTTARSRMAVRDQFATEHQALIVAHNDSGNAHCHVVVNRVHPEHGVLLPESHDFRRLSRWAQKYDHEFNKGKLAVPQRALNNARRDAGDRVYMKRVPRDVYELELAHRDQRPATLAVQAAQQEADKALAKASATERVARKQAWRELEERHAEERKDLKSSAQHTIEVAAREAGESFAGDRESLFHEQEAAKRAFEHKEHNLLGKAMNAIKAMKLKGGWNVLWSQGAREEVFEKALAAQERDLEARVNRAKEEAAREERARLQAKIVELGYRATRERAELIVRLRRDAAKLRTKWRERQKDRKQAWEDHQKAMEALPPEKRHGAQTTTPDETMKTAARQHMERMRKRREERRLERDRDDGRSR